MRKILIMFLVLALVAIFGVMVVSGIEIGTFEVGHSVQEIINKNSELDSDIAALNTRIQTEYANTRTNLDTSYKKLQAEKQNYQSAIAYTTEEERQAANQTEEYKLEYLWTNIGLYATKHNVTMKADLSYGTSGVSNQYNMSFTVTGPYLSISEFVYEIEKDPELGFRIEEFTLVPYAEGILQGTFIIKNISIDPTSLSKSASVSNGTVTNNQVNNGDTKTSNPTNTNTNTDTTNTVKNTNTNTVNTGS